MLSPDPDQPYEYCSARFDCLIAAVLAQTCRNTCYSFETGEKGPALNVLMASIDPDNAAEYNANAQNFFNLYLQQVLQLSHLDDRQRRQPSQHTFRCRRS